MRYEGLYTPPDLKGTLMFPGTRGGTNWGGAAFDPATKVLYIRSTNAPDIQTIIRQDPKVVAGMPLVDQGRRQYSIYCGACHGGNKAEERLHRSLTLKKERLGKMR